MKSSTNCPSFGGLGCMSKMYAVFAVTELCAVAPWLILLWREKVIKTRPNCVEAH